MVVGRGVLPDNLLPESSVIVVDANDIEPISPDSRISIGKSLALLIQEHDNARVRLPEIRSLSRNFIAPEYACTTYHAFFDGLRDFERDLHRHVHLENNILFPRALELEAANG